MSKDGIIVTCIYNWMNIVQIFTHGARYDCPTKEENGELWFWFKRTWYRVSDHITDCTVDQREKR